MESIKLKDPMNYRVIKILTVRFCTTDHKNGNIWC